MPRDQEDQRKQEGQFYSDLFIHSGTWSTPGPNTDERMRWEKIKRFLPEVIQRLPRIPSQPIRILDVGCGRGWLTNLLSEYGRCEGIEPVEAVVEYGRTLFPNLIFHVGFPDVLLTHNNFQPYDLIVTSEVIEHIPYEEKATFVRTLQQLLKPDGAVILSTPRREVWEQWQTVSTPNQPIEDWITEPDLLEIFQNNGFHELGRDRIYFDLQQFQYVTDPSEEHDVDPSIIPLYQVWAFNMGVPVQNLHDQRGSATCLQSLAMGSEAMSVKPHAVDSVLLEKPEGFSQSGNPLVSVIVPTFNRPRTLKVALQSIHQQTFTDYEVIVINDAGEDVVDIVALFNTRNNVSSIRHGQNRGLAAARNSGLGVARGKYIAYLDDDDRFLPNHLETLVNYLEGSSCQVAYSDAWRIWQIAEHGQYVEGKRDVPYSKDFNPEQLLLTNFFPVLCMMHEKVCLGKTGIFDETLTTHEDWDLWIRLSRHYHFAHLPEVTAEFTWRVDGSSMTSRIPKDYLRTKRLIYQKYEEYFRLQPSLIPVREQELRNLERRVNSPTFECSIIIPVCNRADLTEQCLTTLVEVTANVPYEVIVVDNGSTDGTQKFLSSLGGDIQIIRNDTNLGFAKACNQGARAARAKHLVFLNNDTIPKSGWLPSLLCEVDSHEDVAVVGSKLLYPDNTIQHAGVIFCREDLMPYHIFNGAAGSLPAVNVRRELQVVSAACMLVRRESFEAVGGFDEGYLNGFEDVDLCLKIREGGGKVVYQPKSMLYHLEHQTPGRKNEDTENANQRRLMERWREKIIPDADIYYVSAGYKSCQYVQDGILRVQATPIADEEENKQWKHLQHVERFLLAKRYSEDKPSSSPDPELRAFFSDMIHWPKDVEVLRWAAKVCHDHGFDESEWNFWTQMLELKDDCEARGKLASHALKLHDRSSASQHIQALLALDSHHGFGLFMQGILFIQSQQYFEASESFRRALEMGFDSLKAGKGLGMAYLGMGDADKSWVEYSKVLAKFPDDVEVVNGLIQAGTAGESWLELCEILERFLARNPTHVAMRFALAGVEFRAGHSQKAREQLLWLKLIAPGYEGLEDLEKLLTPSRSQLNMVSVR